MYAIANKLEPCSFVLHRILRDGALERVEYGDIARCTAIKVSPTHDTLLDTSIFAHLHTLDLSGTNTWDVSALGRVHTLNLCNTNVSDVSALGRVHTLSISNTCVTDIAALQNVHSLDISFTDVTDISMLLGVRMLILYGMRVDASMLKNTRVLF
jgi:hypothetical protein